MNYKLKTTKALALMVLSFAISLLTATSATAQSSYTISGSVEGLPDGTPLVLTPMSHDKEQPLGETTVQGGRFQFSGTATEPICAHIQVKDCYGAATLMLEDRDVTITGSVSKSQAWDGVDSYQWNVSVGGSPLTDQYKTFMSERDQLNQLYAENQQRFAEVHKKMNSLNDEEAKAYRQSDDWKAVEAADAVFFHKVDSVLNGLILRNKDTFWGPLLATANLSYFSPDQRQLYEQFSSEAQQSYYGRRMKAELWPAGSVGEKIEVFTVKDEQGQTVTFADLAKDQRYVLIDFWASWCAPCRKEIPNVKRQYQLYKDKGFQVVSISIDRDAKAWKKAVEEEQLEWPNFLSAEVADKFKVKAVPTMYLVTADGTVVAENSDARGEALARKLAELFAE